MKEKRIARLKVKILCLKGSTVTLVSDEFAEYALNLAATNIVLLVEEEKR